MNNYKDYYKTLGVDRKASQEEVQRAYRKLARKYHPDINKAGDSEDKFKEVNEAYEVLGDPEKRTRYDQLGSGWSDQVTGQSRPAGEQFEYHFSSGDSQQFSDFFQSLFGGSGMRSAAGGMRGGGVRRQRGRDHESTLGITLSDAYHGAKKSIELERLEYDSDGKPRRNRRTYDVTIPPGVTDGSLIRLAGQGGAVVAAVRLVTFFCE